MQILDISKCYQKPKAECKIDASMAPGDWQAKLAQLVENFIKSQGDINENHDQIKIFSNNIGKHIGTKSKYHLKKQLIESLQKIYLFLIDENTTKEIKDKILVGLPDGIINCSAGYHSRIQEVAIGLGVSQDLRYLCAKYRKNLVDSAAMSAIRAISGLYEGNEVHTYHRFSTIAAGQGYGVIPTNSGDPYQGEIGDSVIKTRLENIFGSDYTFFNTLHYIYTQIRGELAELGYSLDGDTPVKGDDLSIIKDYMIKFYNHKEPNDIEITDMFTEDKGAFYLNRSKIKVDLIKSLLDLGYFKVSLDEKVYIKLAKEIIKGKIKIADIPDEFFSIFKDDKELKAFISYIGKDTTGLACKLLYKKYQLLGDMDFNKLMDLLVIANSETAEILVVSYEDILSDNVNSASDLIKILKVVSEETIISLYSNLLKTKIKQHRNEVFIIASANGYNNVLSALLATGTNPNSFTISSNPLLLAIKCGQYDSVRLLLNNKQPANPNVVENNGNTALIFAIIKGHPGIMQLLIENGADLNCEDENNGSIALQFAAQSGCIDIVNLLLNHSGDTINHKSDNGNTALLWIVDGKAKITEKHVDCARRLLQQSNIDINVTNADGNTALSLTVKNNHEQLTKLLLEHGANSKESFINGLPVLHWAAQHGKYSIIELLIKNGVDLNFSDKHNGSIALQFAAQNGHFDIVILLLENAENTVNHKSNNGNTALFWIAENHNKQTDRQMLCAEILLQQSNIELNATNEDGNTALVLAVNNNHERLTGILLEQGANPNVRSNIKGGESSLLAIAVTTSDLVVFEMLLQYGAKSTESFIKGFPVLIWAAKHGRHDVIELLIENGVDLNLAVRECGFIALRLAAQKEYMNIVDLLQINGAKIEPALDYAKNNKEDELVKLLESLDTPFNRAINKEDIQMIRRCVTARNDVNEIGKNGQTPLSLIARKGDKCLDIIDELLAADNIEINKPNTQGVTPLIIAIENGQIHAVRKLIAKQVGKHDLSEFLCAASYIGNIESVKLLLGRDDVLIDEHTPLVYAASKDHNDIVELLLDKKANVNKPSKNRATALYWAAHKYNWHVIDLLQIKGAQIEPALEYAKKKNEDYIINLLEGLDTPLNRAINKADIQMAQRCIKAGNDVNNPGKNGETPLTLAVQKADKHPAIFDTLLALDNIEINKPNAKHSSPIGEAIRTGQIETVKKLLAKGVDVNQSKALLSAVYYGSKDIVQLLLEQDDIIIDQHTPLINAAKRGRHDIVGLLLDKNANVNKPNENGATALYWAAHNENFDMIDSLQINGAGIYLALTHAKKHNDDSVIRLLESLDTPLNRAIDKVDVQMMRRCMIARNDVNMQGRHGETPLTLAVQKGDKYPAIIDLLLAVDNIEINKPNAKHSLPIGEAIRTDQIETVKKLLAKGANINESGALWCAVCTDNKDIVKLLLKREDIISDNADTLRLAASYRHYEIVEMLLDKNSANVNRADVNGITALYWAVHDNDIKMVDLLLSYGADAKPVLVYAKNKKINNDAIKYLKRVDSPFNRAINKGDIQEVKRCIIAKNNINDLGINNGTPLSLAVRKGQIEIVRLLLTQEKILVNGSEREKISPLMYAVQNDCYDTVTMLLIKNADINKTCKNGLSAVDIAVKRKDSKMIDLLLKKDSDLVVVPSRPISSCLQFGISKKHKCQQVPGARTYRLAKS